MLCEIRNIRHTPIQQIRSRFPDQILQPTRNEPRPSAAHPKAQPAREPFPEFALPDQVLWYGFWNRGTGDEDKAHEDDYYGRDEHGDYDEDFTADGVLLVGKGNIGVAERERASVGGDCGEPGCDGAGGSGSVLVCVQ